MDQAGGDMLVGPLLATTIRELRFPAVWDVLRCWARGKWRRIRIPVDGTCDQMAILMGLLSSLDPCFVRRSSRRSSMRDMRSVFVIVCLADMSVLARLCS
jgi:hypothetical protein